jgi:formylglycine-generating enzyme required for sulfatase activity
LQQFDRYVCQGEDCGEHPQVCVDWCDAQAYCEAAGKRLCGSIGGGATPFARGNARPAGAPLGQWENACSAAGKTRFPYGDKPRAEACNTSDGGRGTTAKVGEMSACQSTVEGYRDILDLSGNAWEWEDACEDETADAFCHVRGGSFNSETALDECSAVHTYHRDFASYFVGFRCCAD